MSFDTPVMQHLPGPGRSLRLDADLTILHVAALRRHLLAWLHGGTAAEPAHLDLSAITGIDTAGVQLLLALRRSLAATGRALVLQDPPPAVTEVLRRYNLTDRLPTAPTGGPHGHR